jgi:hypothetical protein
VDDCVPASGSAMSAPPQAGQLETDAESMTRAWQRLQRRVGADIRSVYRRQVSMSQGYRRDGCPFALPLPAIASRLSFTLSSRAGLLPRFDASVH